MQLEHTQCTGSMCSDSDTLLTSQTSLNTNKNHPRLTLFPGLTTQAQHELPKPARAWRHVPARPLRDRLPSLVEITTLSAANKASCQHQLTLSVVNYTLQDMRLCHLGHH